MARKALYKHATQVDANTYPDDGSSPVGTNEWNEAPDPQGMLGFTPQTSTITISSGVLTVTDSVTVAAAETGTSDDLDKLAITNTNEYDLIYLFADTGDTITLKHTGSLSADGQIQTVSGADETLSVTKPTILIRKGNYWYGYGGGTVSDGSITNTKLADMAANTVKVRNANSSGAPSDIAVADTQILIGDGTGFTAASLSGDATMTNAGVVTIGTLNQDTTGNAATVTTNANLTGEVTSIGNASTIADNVVDEANLKVSNTPTNGYVLTARSGNTGGMTWEATSGGGATIVHTYSNTTNTSYTGTASSFGTVGVGDRDIYIKKIDANNEGVFTKIWKNGSAIEVQIA